MPDVPPSTPEKMQAQLSLEQFESLLAALRGDGWQLTGTKICVPAGAVADAVGLRLRKLAANAQVLVVTHSPQVAARAAIQWKVSKAGDGGHTRTAVSTLSDNEREEEIARMLAGYQQRVALIEARDDVGDGTSKANTAILHTGFDAKPESVESALVARGYRLLSEYAVSTGIPVERTGAILVAWDQDQLDALPALKDKAKANGYRQCELIDAATVYARLPHLGPGALGGMTVPDESITCTWTVNLALATDAVSRGAVGARDRSTAPSGTCASSRTGNCASNSAAKGRCTGIS